MVHGLPVIATCFRPARVLVTCVLLSLPLNIACSAPREAPRVDVPVVVDSSGLKSVVTNLGYDVSVSRAAIAIRDLEFAVAGEVHSSLWQKFSDAVVPAARAHPGHYQGGEIAGELPGSFLLHFEGDKVEPLGTATLLVGDYRSMNFFFSRDDGEELLDHTCVMRGNARKGTEEVTFSVTLDSPEGRQLVGAPFEQRVDEGTELVVGLRLLVQDTIGSETLFDGVDFLALDDDSDGRVDIVSDSSDARKTDAYVQIQRRFQTHNHFDARAQD